MMRISLDSPALIAVRSWLAGSAGRQAQRAGRSGRRKASRLHFRGEQLEPRMMLDAGMRAMLPDLVAESDTAPQQINYGLGQGIQVDFRFSDAATSMGNLSADNITSDRTPELTGSVRGGVSQVRLFIDGRRGDLLPVTNGTWKYQVPATAALTPGRHTVAVRPVHTSGRVGPLSRPLNLTIMAAAPNAPTLGLGAMSDTGAKGDKKTTVATPMLRGIAQPGRLVSVSIDGEFVGRVRSDARTGVWSLKAPRLASGVHDVTAVAENRAGIRSAATSFQVTIIGERTVMLEANGDNATEGTLFVSAADSPNNRELLITSNEGTNTLTIFQNPVFTLQLLHFSDAEASLLASTTTPKLAALVDAFEDQFTNSITLAGGDNYIPGPFVAAGTDPTVAATHNTGDNPFAADIEIHNRIGVQASTIGNHEFDNGTRAFSDAINDTAFPYLSANLDFSSDADIRARYQETVGTGGLEEASTLARKIVPSAVITVNGEKIGLVGATTQIVEQIASTGGVEVKGFTGDGSERDNMALLASQLQPVINDLTSQGVNKVILMAHLQQLANERALAPLLTGVDIILAAGSNTRLGDANDVAVAFNGHTANFADTYPIITAGADSKPTLIVNTDNEYTYLGRLVVDFNTAGEIVVSNLAARSAINGAYAATDANVAAAWGVGVSDLATTAYAEGTRGEQVADITEAVQAVIVAKDGDVKGFTEVYLEGERNVVRNQETNLGNLSADANAYATQLALGNNAGFVVSLKNGGGIRTAIGATDVVTGAKLAPIANDAANKPEGGVSLLDIENSLRFDNKLMVFDTTAAGLKAILEHGVASLGNQGRFPQIGGVAFSYDPSAAAGSRIRDLALNGDGYTVNLYSDGVAVAGVPAKITVVTLSFLAGGGDGYPIPANGTNFRYLTLTGEQIGVSASGSATAPIPTNALGEQKAFSSFMEGLHGTPATAFAKADTAAALDTRIQSTAVRSEAVLAPSNAIVADASVTAGNNLRGGRSDDVFVLARTNDRANGSGGVDTVLSVTGLNLSDKRFSSIENATLLGTDDLALVGSKSANRLIGNLGDNRLDGGRGNDTLTGGAGDDLFVLRKGSIDTITDFARGQDKLVLFARDFKALADFGLEADDFSTFFTYNAATGAFSVDTNGKRSGGVVQIAIIGNRPDALDASGLLIV